jgi:hypothetical protein
MSDQVQRLIRLTREQDDALRKLAFEQRVSVAEVVRRIVEERLSEKTKTESGKP